MQLAFLMAATSACEVHESAAATGAAQQQPGAEGGARPTSSGALNLARSYLAQSRAAGAALQAAQAMEGQQGGADPKSDVFAALLVSGWMGWCVSMAILLAGGGSMLRAVQHPAFMPLVETQFRPGYIACPHPPQDLRLACLSQDTATQLEALERCKALPAFGAEHFTMAAAVARGCASGGAGTGSASPAGSLEVCRAAEAARLQRLTQQVPMDYAAVAAVSSAAVC